jgi:acyl carrier protein
MELHADLLEMIATEVSLDPSAEIVGSTDLLLTGLVDSLGIIDVVAWLEDRLDLTIEPSDIVLEHFQTVDLMTEFIGRLTAGA